MANNLAGMLSSNRDGLGLFLTQFLILQLLLSALFGYFRLLYFPDSRTGYWANAFFSLYSLASYLLAMRQIGPGRGSAFIRLVMGGSALKIGGAILLLAILHIEVRPLAKPEVILFLVVYVLFTIFETNVLMRLGKSR